jgi:plastocyanin
MVSRMLRFRFVALPIAAAFAFMPATSHGQSRNLTGTVGPGSTITLRDASGAEVRHLDAGQYTIAVSDLADIHNFHLFGPGVNELTTVEGIGPATWNVTFRDGIYTYQCDPHLDSMQGRFAVGSATLPTPRAAPTRLSGRVGPGARITLTNAAGKRATQVKAGRYRITVRDVSRTDNFHLTGPGLNRKTGVRFRGTTTWTVSLKAGRYVYRSDRSKKLRGVVTVTATAIHAGHGA